MSFLRSTDLYRQNQRRLVSGSESLITPHQRDHRNDLTEDDQKAVLERLLHHFVRLTNAGDEAMVVRKLCSSLTAYFLRPTSKWDRCLARLILGFVKPDLSTDDIPDSSAFSAQNLTGILNNQQLLAIFWFAEGLAEEARQAIIGSAAT